MTPSHFPLLFLQASISALLVSGAAWALLHLARRRWPGLEARRAPWLLAQLTVIMTLVCVMLPGASGLSLFAAAPEPAAAGAEPYAAGSETMIVLEDAAGDLPAADLLPALAWLWLASFLIGAAWHVRRWRRAGRELRTLLCVAERLDDAALQAHPAFAARRMDRDGLPPAREIDAPVSPMLVGVRHPVLLLPRHLRDLPPAQQQLVVAHELMHLRRGDHLWQHAGALLQLALWFVPAVRSFQARLQWALELGCDRAVLAGRTQTERRSYAAALLAQLAVQAKTGHDGRGLAPVPLAFGSRGTQAVAERVRLIRDAQPMARAPLAVTAALLLLPALCGASVLLQPQFAWHDAADADLDPDPAAALSAAGANAAVAPVAPVASWQAPLARPRVTSSFGSTNRPGGKPHRGMDFGARRGTAVLASADGTVAISTDRYEGGARYGKVVVIEHAGGARTLYAHLDARRVQAGERVRAGQQIALSGATGKVTGPHLHFEISRQGAPVDPQALLGGAQ